MFEKYAIERRSKLHIGQHIAVHKPEWPESDSPPIEGVPLSARESSIAMPRIRPVEMWFDCGCKY